MRRPALVVFLVVFLAGQAAVGMRASRTAATTGDEPFYLLTVQSLVSDGDLDLRDEYANEEMRSFWDGTVPLWKQMTPAPDGRLLAPHDPGLPLLLVPAYALGGLRGVQRFLVLLWALAMAAMAVVALRTKAPQWAAVLAAVAVGAGVPGLVYGSQVYPEATAALLLSLALLLVTDERARPFLFAAVLFALAWLGVKYVPLGTVLAVGYARRHPVDRRAVALLALGAVHFVWWHQHTFGGLTPYSTNIVWSGEGDSSILADHVDWGGRSYRLYGLFLDARFGLFRWLPLAPLALWGITRRTAAYLAPLAVCVLMGTFVSITIMGWWFPGRMLIAGLPVLVVLIAHGAARLPRTAAVLAAWSLAVAAAVALAAHTEAIRLAVDPFTVGFPLPPHQVFPDFRAFGARQVTLTIAWGAALTMLLWRSSSSSTATPSPTGPSSPFPPIWRPLRAR
ncbi:MAG TPA: hypothetical protein VM938_07690 [Acidimicrobiales bacterium]|nr:hypothetical protein [Acidimicrobiales bacterium]